MKETRFTPDQLAGVFVARWQARDMANAFIDRLRPSTLIGRIGSSERINTQVGRTIRFPKTEWR